jgi:hypothetical protein
MKEKPLAVSEKDLMRIIRCAIFYDSAMTELPPQVFMQLSLANKEKLRQWLEYEHKNGPYPSVPSP